VLIMQAPVSAPIPGNDVGIQMPAERLHGRYGEFVRTGAGNMHGKGTV
jgi:hypothetical protein